MSESDIAVDANGGGGGLLFDACLGYYVLAAHNEASLASIFLVNVTILLHETCGENIYIQSQ